MAGLSYDRCCTEIVAQTELLRSCIEGADLTVPVPSCPGWNAGQLLRHLGGGQRWAEAMVRSRASEPLPDDHFQDLSAYTNEDPATVGPREELRSRDLHVRDLVLHRDGACVDGVRVRAHGRTFACRLCHDFVNDVNPCSAG